MAEPVSCWPLTVKAQFHLPASPCRICGGQCGTGTGISPSASFTSVSIIPLVFHTHLFMYHLRYVILTTATVVTEHTLKKLMVEGGNTFNSSEHVVSFERMMASNELERMWKEAAAV